MARSKGEGPRLNWRVDGTQPVAHFAVVPLEGPSRLLMTFTPQPGTLKTKRRQLTHRCAPRTPISPKYSPNRSRRAWTGSDLIRFALASWSASFKL